MKRWVGLTLTYDPFIGRFISPDTIVQAPYNPQSLNRYSYCLNNPLNYTDPSGHFWKEIIDGITGWIGDQLSRMMEFFPSICGGLWEMFDSIGNGFMKTMEWVSEQNIWGVQGVAETTMGVGNIIGGTAKGNVSQIGSGFKQIGKAVYDTVESAVVDAAAVAIGQASHIYTIPRDLINVGKNMTGKGEDGILGAVGATLLDIAIPRYGLGGGAGYGLSRDKNTKEIKHTFGNRFINSPLNETDAANFQHDLQYKHTVWVGNQLSFSEQPRISGVGGLMYKAIGVVPFGVAGILQNKGIGPQPNF